MTILLIAIISAESAAIIESSTTLKTTSVPKTNKEDNDVKVEITLTKGDKNGMALINKIVLADEQIQMDADMVDAAQPLLDYMMQKSIDYISKQVKVSTSHSTNHQQHHSKPMSKKLFKQVIKPLMEIYLKEIPTEARRLFQSANKMVVLNNGIEKMNATTAGVAGGPLSFVNCNNWCNQPGCNGYDPCYCGECSFSHPLEYYYCCY